MTMVMVLVIFQGRTLRWQTVSKHHAGGDDYDTAAADDKSGEFDKSSLPISSWICQHGLIQSDRARFKKQKSSAGKGGVAVRNQPLFTWLETLNLIFISVTPVSRFSTIDDDLQVIIRKCQQNINHQYISRGNTWHYWLTVTFMIFSWILFFFDVTAFWLSSGCVLAHWEPERLRNLFPDAICAVHFGGIFGNI